ncbi:hypothetical protein BED46_036920 [Burkholderia contaminans]|uniref:Uncharacterized protein n=1 Tax=Burkholderia contaminans LMG 23361 TaxID=1334628 RepID=A0ABD4ANF6_9BURK|nr:hypothetical protein WR31_25840 [Burkholderia contaminans LMG 23361]ODN28940.1 hypothetical protein BGI28_32735 [Burkholderia contaminans]OMI77089.1 hypothetical protein BED46_036920 [Burkholderia contaminans]
MAYLTIDAHRYFQEARHRLTKLLCEEGRHGIADLVILLCAVSLKKIIIRESLQARCFAHRQTATL